ncbi:hypothetical protein ACFY7C_20475 [Streptomyces sp. NPDC012769]|uniref:hypothetical protein n=1 Tax=Streptomyces sp. NPDC012769 TaxID=3364848 RepID=UPI00367AA9F6
MKTPYAQVGRHGRTHPAVADTGAATSTGTGTATGRRVGPFGPAPLESRIHWLLRVAIAAEFIGHGAFGIMGKEAWLGYYAVMGIPPSAAWVMMPITGSVDIALGLLVLLRPTRAPLAYMAFWGLFTALLRPLSGESWWEVFERSYNFGVPLALLLFHGVATSRSEWLARIRGLPRLTRRRAKRFTWGFRLIIASFLIGHGGYGAFVEKRNLTEQYESIGLTSVTQAVGWFEIGLGALVLVTMPGIGLLLFVCVWKIATEMLYVTSGAYGAPFEVIERASCYAAPLALICFIKVLARETPPTPTPTPTSERGPRGESSAETVP